MRKKRISFEEESAKGRWKEQSLYERESAQWIIWIECINEEKRMQS